jgi:hypothetical protein
MRQAIKSDGSDGTTALKAWLAAHGDEVLKQELYQFGQIPQFIKQAQAFGNIGGFFLHPGTVGLGPIAAGDVLLAFMVNGDGGATPGIGDTAGNSWTHILNNLGCSSGLMNAWWAIASGAEPSDAVTFTTAGNRGNSAFFVIVIPAQYSSFVFGSAGGVGILASVTTSDGYTLKVPDGPNVAAPWTMFSISFGSSQQLQAIGFVNFGLAGQGPTDTNQTVIEATPGGGPTYVVQATKPVPFGYTDASSPLTYAGHLWSPAIIRNNGFKSKIGMDVDSLELNWTFRGDEPMVTDPSTGATILTMLQAFRYGLWAGVWVKWRRIYMPTFGDCETLAALSMFRGRIGPVTVDRLTAKITVNSITESFNRQVPAQLIEANNRSGQIGPGLPPDLNADPTHWTKFQCATGAGGTVQKIVADETSPTPDQVYAPGTFDLGYLLFGSSPLDQFVAQVQHYDVVAGHSVFYLFKPLYVDPHAYTLKFTAFVPVPKDQTISGASGVELKPFPFVPLPEQAV